jgi:hypothetical protein
LLGAVSMSKSVDCWTSLDAIKNHRISNLPLCCTPRSESLKRADRDKIEADTKANESRSEAARGPGRTYRNSADLRDFKSLVFIVLTCFGRLPKSQCNHEWALGLASVADLVRHVRHFSNRIRSRGSRGPPQAPEGRSRQSSNSGSGLKAGRSRPNP